MARIFVSYSRQDQDFARRLATSLSNMGADVWIDIEDIPAGMKWSSAIQQGLDSGQLLIVLISPESMASRNVEDEWQYYLDSNKPVVPVLLRPAKIHFQLNRLQYIDFHGQPYDQGIAQLYTELWAKGLSLNPPAESPAQEIPNLDDMSPQEIERWLAILKERQEAFSQTTTQHQQVTPAKAGQRRAPWLIAAVAVLALVAVVAGVLIFSSLGDGAQNLNDDATATAAAVAQAQATASAQAGQTADDDGDGLSNAEEAELGTYTDDPDSDGDGLNDKEEFDAGLNPMLTDSDQDGLADPDEIEVFFTDPLLIDTDGDGLADGDEVGSCTSPLVYDSDEDGISDDVEVQQGTECDTAPEIPGLSLDDPITHSDQWTPIERNFNGIPMLLVPVGSFVKGTALEATDALIAACTPYLSQNDCRGLVADEVPAYNTGFRQPYWIDRYEVDDNQFRTYGGQAGGSGDWPNGPRSNVTWLEAQNFCEARGGRLPTEPEWEFAARGPESRVYPWGNEITGPILNFCDGSCEFNWRDANLNDGFAVPAPVGSFPAGASWVGAEDMAGNLWEWTSTIYQQDARSSYEDPDDERAQRTLKGGSWNWVLTETRGAARSPHANNTPRSPWYGFRCVRDFDLADLEAP